MAELGLFGGGGQGGQSIDRAGDVEELGVGVDVGGELGLGMTHGGLGGAERHIDEGGSCDEFSLGDEATCTSLAGTFVPNGLCTGDCNGNALVDACEVATGTTVDCNGDLVPDECQLYGNDTNHNAIPDEGDGFTIIYVDANAAGLDDGSSWTDAYNSLQDALFEAASFPGVSNIWIAAGTYHPDENAGIGSGDRTAKFILEEGIHLFGGLAGGESSLNERDPLTNRTVLSGDLLDNDDLTAFPHGTSFDDNSYQVLFSSAPEDIVLDELVISGGMGAPRQRPRVNTRLVAYWSSQGYERP